MMKKVYKPCPSCGGTGSFPVISEADTTSIMKGEIMYYTTCSICYGTGCSDELIGIVEE